MYRILKADKDAYITNKLIQSTNSSLSRSTDASTGMAGSCDIFKILNQITYPTASGVELSRGLIHFDLDELRALTGSVLNFADSSFKCYVSMKDVYGGQTVPSNYSLVLYPLAQAFDEGRGFDVIGYRDLDAANWFTASLDNGVITTWVSGGAGAGGAANLLAPVDYYTFLSGTYTSLGAFQSFARGDEDLLIDVTTAVSATLAGLIPDYGFRLSFSGSQETDSVTRFVKRFSTIQSRNTNLHPCLVMKYNDTFIDNQNQAYLDFGNKIGIYNSPFASPTNFMSGTSPVVGSGSLKVNLVASQSAYVTTTSYSTSHQMNITYLSASWNVFSQTFTGSQIIFGGTLNQTGSYYADVFIPSTQAGLSGVISSGGGVELVPTWTSLDNTLIFAVGPSITLSPSPVSHAVTGQRNYTINITNLQESYINTDVTTMRVFVYDYEPTLTSYYLPYREYSRIVPFMYWRLIDPFTKEILIPFDDVGTKLSSDGDGMWFKLYMQDLPINKQFEIQFVIKENGQTFLIQNQGFTFKVVTA